MRINAIKNCYYVEEYVVSRLISREHEMREFPYDYNEFIAVILRIVLYYDLV